MREEDMAGQPPDPPPGDLLAALGEDLEFLQLALGLPIRMAGEAELRRGTTGYQALLGSDMAVRALEPGLHVRLVRELNRLRDSGRSRQAVAPPRKHAEDEHADRTQPLLVHHRCQGTERGETATGTNERVRGLALTSRPTVEM